MPRELVDSVERKRICALLAPLFDEIGDGKFDARVHLLQVTQLVVREAQRVQVEQIAEIEHAGGFSERGERARSAVAELLGIEPGAAARLVNAAEYTMPRVGLTGDRQDPLL